jgi:hypothetical protein
MEEEEQKAQEAEKVENVDNDLFGEPEEADDFTS